jgi:DNA mismatch endonuclease, patch repair protein
MSDFMTVAQRSAAMSAVRSTETEIERTLRSHLHRQGFRFRKNVKDLPGRPDIVLPKHRCVVFVHGCFWHHHKNCKRSKLPATRASFWSKKIGDNVKRDQRQTTNLRNEGWRVLTVWECELRDPKNQTRVVENLVVKLTNGSN